MLINQEMAFVKSWRGK